MYFLNRMKRPLKTYLLIINPNSGQGKYKKHLEIIKKYFLRNNVNLDICFTEYKGHATEIAKEASCSDKYSVIIGAGGDGTINEVLTGMIDSNKTMAILPWGTGNVFAREMNIPFNPKKACKLILKNKSIKIDIAKCNNNYFFLMCSCGFDAYSIKHTEELKIKKIFGKISYIIGGLKAFARYKFPEIEVELDNGIKDKGTYVLVSNTSKYAIYFSITPYAIPFDGLLDVYIFKETGKFNFFKLLGQLIISAFVRDPKKRNTIFLRKEAFYRSKSIIISSKEKVITQIDGDLYENLPLNIQIIPQALNFILPAKIVKKYRKYMEKYDFKKT